MTDWPAHFPPLNTDFVCPSWDDPGRCPCGAELPPMSKWNDAGRDWSHVTCGACGTAFVDEEEFIAIYDDGLEPGGES